jgi:hypothetical protein
MSVFKKALTLKLPKQRRTTRKPTERDLLQRESEIGRQLFGPIPNGHRREFFCLDATTCIWYESYKDADGKEVAMTTRYEIQGERILKAQEGARYNYLEGQELENILLAIDMYYERVMSTVYGQGTDSAPSLA